MSSSLQGRAGLTLEQETCVMSQSLRVPNKSPGLNLKLYEAPDETDLQSPDDGPPEDLDWMGSMSLRNIFDVFYLEELKPKAQKGVKESTLKQYEDALGHWERLTGDPCVREISGETLRCFAEAAQGPAHRASTCNKWIRHIKAILNYLGPRTHRDSRSRRALMYYCEVPWICELEEPEPDPVELDDSQIDAIYAACVNARWPLRIRPPRKDKPAIDTHVDPVDWWRCVLVLGINYGLRRDDWYHLPTSAVSFSKGTFIYTAEKTGKRQELVLNDAVSWHLKKMNFADRQSIFLPTQSHRQLYREWARIQEAAGIVDRNGQPVIQDFHALRSTCAARYHENFPGTAELLLGHALPRNVRVTGKHYLGKQLLKPVWNAIRKIKQPDSFISAIQSCDPRQKKLFD